MREHAGPAHGREANLPRGLFTPDRLGLTVALVLVALASVAWAASYFLMNSMMGEMGMGPVLAIEAMAALFLMPHATTVAFFVAVWVVGMVAMMFPAMTPVVAIYNRGYAKSDYGPRLTRVFGTPLFLGGYLLLYAALGATAFGGLYLAFTLGARVPALMTYAPFAVSATLVAAGLWQLTSLKDACLRHCVSPFGFFFTHARTGLSGALRMGLAHGYYCVGCCWLYMLVMLAVGAMSLPAMAILAGVISVEKVLVRGARWYTRLVALGFVTAGIVSLVYPTVLLVST